MESPQRRSAGDTPLLERADWCSYFEAIDTASEELLASVVLSRGGPRLNNVGKARHLHAISYDDGAQTLAVDVGDPRAEKPFLRYFVSAPRSIGIHEHPGGKVIAVVDASGACTLILVSRRALPSRTRRPATRDRGVMEEWAGGK